MSMEQDHTIRWALVIMAFIAIVAGAFLMTGQPIVGNTIAMVPHMQSCASVDTQTVESCKALCTGRGLCDTYQISCGKQVACTCTPCTT